jgi:hypothetical protein
MVLVVTVTRALTTEVVALHRSGETFTATHRCYVNSLANCQSVDFDLLANFETVY